MEYYEVYGVEREDATWNVKRGELVKKRVPRSLGQGIYVSKGDLKGADIFRVHEFPAWIFCTNRVKGFIEREGFTNVVFFEMGELT